MKRYCIEQIGFFSCLLVLQCIMGIGSISAQSSAGDVAKIKKLIAAVDAEKDINTDSAFKLIDQLKKICAVVKIDTLTAKAYGEEAYCNYYAGDYKKAAHFFDSSAFLWKNKSLLNYFKAINNKANALMYNSEYHKALLSFFECLEISNQLKNESLTGQVLNNIGLVYESVGDYDNALLYGKKALAYKLTTNDSLSIAHSYGNIGDAFLFKEMADSALLYEGHSYQLYSLIVDKEGMSNALGDIGNIYNKKGNTDSAITYLQRAIVISKQLSHAENTANFLNNLGEAYLQKKDFKKVWHFASQADSFVSQITDNEFLQEHYNLLYQYYKQTGNTAQAFNYLEKINVINDSIFKQKINIQNEKVAFEYEYNQKKLKDSLVFQSEVNTSKNIAVASKNKFVVSLLLLLLVASLAVMLYSRSKLLQKKHIVAQQNVMMQEQKIKDLENEKRLLASQGVLKGQEEERRRLSKDLHDGLGGLLSGVKYSIINMKENTIISNDNVSMFEKSLNMIDTAMRELRRVAQNMMPEALAKFGLEEALKDYCAAACTSSVKVIFQSFGENIIINSTSEIIIYRIIQELVNNAVKHSNAAQVMVQLVKGEDWITLSVEDNGAGFDINKLKQSTGSGWGNIKSRVDYLKGDIDLKSQAGTGTSVNIEIKNPQQ